MEIQLQELIEQIKSDGAAVAEREAASKLEAARAEAEQIVAAARAQADQILRQAKEENDRMVRSSEAAIRQTGRNLMLSFRESVTRELNAILSEQMVKGYTPDVMTQLIPKVVEAWAGNAGAEDVSVLLNSKDLAAMEGGLLAALKKRAGKGVTLKANDDFQGGFRIAVEKGRAYYDYSAESVAELFAAYLNPRVAALMKEAD